MEPELPHPKTIEDLMRDIAHYVMILDTYSPDGDRDSRGYSTRRPQHRRQARERAEFIIRRWIEENPSAQPTA